MSPLSIRHESLRRRSFRRQIICHMQNFCGSTTFETYTSVRLFLLLCAVHYFSIQRFTVIRDTKPFRGRVNPTPLDIRPKV